MTCTGVAESIGMPVPAKLMRYEGSIVESPQQVIERFRLCGGFAQDEHAQIAQIGLLGEPAGKRSNAVSRAALFKT